MLFKRVQDFFIMFQHQCFLYLKPTEKYTNFLSPPLECLYLTHPHVSPENLLCVLRSVNAPQERNWEAESRDVSCCFIPMLPFESVVKNIGQEGFIWGLKEFFIAVVNGLGIKNRNELLFAETCMLLGKWNLPLKMCISSSLNWQFVGPSPERQLGPRKPRRRGHLVNRTLDVRAIGNLFPILI